MKYIDEYRDAKSVHKLVAEVKNIASSKWRIMEVCGGQTHAIMRFGIDKLLPNKITLLHGPGCPVCVTPLELIDQAIMLASDKDIIFCSFGDMLRVPGSQDDLMAVKAKGGDVRVCYSPMDALKIAKENKLKQVVFFAIGFETTAPANAMTVFQVKKQGITNFSVLSSQVLIPPAIELLLKSKQNKINAFLAPGHVCAVTGFADYERITSKYNIPIVITGFEPLDLLKGVHQAVTQLEQGEAKVENAYGRVVKKTGNVKALDLINSVFKVVDRKWRGFGIIEKSGYDLNDEYSAFNAIERFNLPKLEVKESTVCISGEILQGVKKPNQCPAFGKKCTPEKPLGATMVSSEGACAAYFRYKDGR